MIAKNLVRNADVNKQFDSGIAEEWSWTVGRGKIFSDPKRALLDSLVRDSDTIGLRRDKVFGKRKPTGRSRWIVTLGISLVSSSISARILFCSSGVLVPHPRCRETVMIPRFAELFVGLTTTWNELSRVSPGRKERTQTILYAVAYPREPLQVGSS